MFRRIKKGEHSSLIQEPDSVHIGHITPTSGSPEDIVTSIISYLSDRGISLEKLVVIGCDGTAINTGWKNEPNVFRRIHLVICTDTIVYSSCSVNYLVHYKVSIWMGGRTTH
ncbi:hypothetical protein AVEN_52992-1 [Araneus ventricosus]|uniref:Uncharacterized protein n=1 Tax=Araneus ventricosus TaxID=182803 RepID=A0A4Y2SXH9_ARAVE|nr:hypothetical protein AVEN_52992-1 [Araneus ventricosus]